MRMDTFRAQTTSVESTEARIRNLQHQAVGDPRTTNQLPPPRSIMRRALQMANNNGLCTEQAAMLGHQRGSCLVRFLRCTPSKEGLEGLHNKYYASFNNNSTCNKLFQATIFDRWLTPPSHSVELID